MSGFVRISRRSRATSARSVSCCELTDTNSPTAIAIAPAASAAAPATAIWLRDDVAAPMPMRMLATDTMPSLAPSTAARSHPLRAYRCRSTWWVRMLLLAATRPPGAGAPGRNVEDTDGAPPQPGISPTIG